MNRHSKYSTSAYYPRKRMYITVRYDVFRKLYHIMSAFQSPREIRVGENVDHHAREITYYHSNLQ